MSFFENKIIIFFFKIVRSFKKYLLLTSAPQARRNKQDI